MTTPIRLQLKRTKGFHLESPNGLPIVNVTRRGKWGNPFAIGSSPLDQPFVVVKRMTGELEGPLTRDQAIEEFEIWIKFHHKGQELAEAAKTELRGKNVACVCGLDEKCHGDVWLRVANED